jgi:P-type E1-E2 ATPase
VNTLLFDKTGTLTAGRPVVLDATVFGDIERAAMLSAAAAAEEKSEHPIARAIVMHAREGKIHWQPATAFEQLPGTGVQVMLDGVKVRVGNARLLETSGGHVEQGRAYLASQEAAGRTALLVSLDDKIVGGLALADTLRPNAREAVSRIREAGISGIVMLTGDNAATAAAIASAAGITEVRAQLLPEDKMKVVSELKSQGRTVAMVGDGVNDAPALMLADVGIAMGAAGTDVAIESAGIALMGDDLSMLSEVLALSRRTLGIIQQNIWVFAVFVNLAGIALATTGKLTPIGAAVVHNMASVFVVLNSARLLTFRRRITGAVSR